MAMTSNPQSLTWIYANTKEMQIFTKRYEKYIADAGMNYIPLLNDVCNQFVHYIKWKKNPSALFYTIV